MDSGKDDPHGSGLIHPVLVPFPQVASDIGVDSYAKANSDCQHKILQGISQRNRGKCIIAEPGHKYAVYYIL